MRRSEAGNSWLLRSFRAQTGHREAQAAAVKPKDQLHGKCSCLSASFLSSARDDPDASLLDGNRKRSLVPGHSPIERVALKWLPPCFLDQPDQIMPAKPLRCRRSRIVVDLFFHHRAVDIIGPKAQRNLRHLGSHHLPVGLDMRKIVQHQPETAICLMSCMPVVMCRCRSMVLAGWNESGIKRLEAMGLVLQGAQFHQVIDPVLVVLDVPIEHGGVGLQPDLVGLRAVSSHSLPSILWSQMIARTRSAEDLGSAAGHRLHARLFHFQQQFRVWTAGPIWQRRRLRPS